MEKNGIKRARLSHTQTMDMQTQTGTLTPEKTEITEKDENTLRISQREAEEFCAYKRQKKLTEINAAISHAELGFDGDADAQALCATMEKFRLASVKMPLTMLALYGAYFTRRGVACDCIVGGTGETLTDVKAREAKLALKYKAKEITLMLAPSAVRGARYAEIRKELKKLRRITRRAYLKVRLDGKYPYALLSRLARICAEEHIDYISVPYFAGCEKLRADLFGGCLMEVSGVENLPDYKKMIGAGVGRILSSHVASIRAEWMREVDEIRFPAPKNPVEEKENKQETEKIAVLPPSQICLPPPVAVKEAQG